MKTKIITILLLTTFFLGTQTIFAQEKSTSSAKIQQTKKYTLPYPGMLPDNPLYKLKVLRDRISLVLIGSPDKKIEYYLLMTDKGLVASEMLVDKQKVELAKETALKAENNYTLLTYVIKDNKWDIKKEQYKKVEDAARKHQELLNNIISKVKKEDKKTFETVLYFSNQNLKEIKNTQKALNLDNN